MLETKSQSRISEMFNAISPKYDLVNRVLSGGLDLAWRKRLIAALPKGNHLDLLDIATGTCDQLLPLLRAGRIGRAVGIDIAEKMIAIGKTKVEEAGFADVVQLDVGSALELPYEDDSFACVTISFGIRNVEEVGTALTEMVRVLKPGGKALILEFSTPKNPLIRPLYLFYLRKLLPTVGGVISGKKEAYQYLNRTIETFPQGEEFRSLMDGAGFAKTVAQPLTFGVATLYVGHKG